MKNNNSNISKGTKSIIKQELASKSLTENSYQEKHSEENSKNLNKKEDLKKFDKTTQSFAPMKKYDKSNKLSKYRELIIDTRNTPLLDINQKFDFVKYRHNKYQIHKYPTKIIKEKITPDKPVIIYSDSNTQSNSDLYNDAIPLKKKIKIMKNQLKNNPILGLIPSYPLSYNHLPHQSIANTLPTLINLRKNQFTEYNQRNENMAEKTEKMKQMQYLMNNNSMPISSYYGNKSNFKKHVDMQNQPFSYIYLLNKSYSISEKMRFQKNMDKLIKVKKCIEENPDEEFDIIKEFILSIGIYDLKQLDIEKLNNFLNFIKSDFLIDPSIDMKENVIKIMNKKKINKAQISNALDCVNEEYVMKEIEKRRNLIKYKKIGDIFSFFEENYKYNRELSQNKNAIKNIKIYKYFNEEKVNKHKKSKSKKILRQKPLQYTGLCIDLKRQQKLYSSENKIDLDIIKNPKNVVDVVKKEIIKIKSSKEYNKNKTCYNWCKNVYKNKRLYGHDKSEDSEYNDIKKNNMLTEYIVLMKAKNNEKVSELRKQFDI